MEVLSGSTHSPIWKCHFSLSLSFKNILAFEISISLIWQQAKTKPIAFITAPSVLPKTMCMKPQPLWCLVFFYIVAPKCTWYKLFYHWLMAMSVVSFSFNVGQQDKNFTNCSLVKARKLKWVCVVVSLLGRWPSLHGLETGKGYRQRENSLWVWLHQFLLRYC